MTRAHLILASRSPRRRELLDALGLEFQVQVADVDESGRPGESPGDMVVRLSRDKARALAALMGASGAANNGSEAGPSIGIKAAIDVAILAADTVVALDGSILGKPTTPAEAVAMLCALRAREHQVYTAVTLSYRDRLDTRLSVSDVTMRDYGDKEIEAYVASGDPMDKAGAYAIQHEWFAPVEQWRGCYTGIMGLPLHAVAELLTEAGLSDPMDVAACCELVSGQRCCRSYPYMQCTFLMGQQREHAR